MAKRMLPKVLKRKPQRIRKVRRILIVCEGEKTEPNYFKAFPSKPEVFDFLDVVGTGSNTVSVVQKAIELKNEAEARKDPYIEVWAVFDRDSFPMENFTKAIKQAAGNGIHCAYSIESFELWYLLHFNYCESQLSRDSYCKKLTIAMNEHYKKNDHEMYKKLHYKMGTALKNAAKLHSVQCQKKLSDQNPITLVFQLVQRLES